MSTDTKAEPFTRQELDAMLERLGMREMSERFKATIARGYAPEKRRLTWRDVLDCKQFAEHIDATAKNALLTGHKYFVHNGRVMHVKASRGPTDFTYRQVGTHEELDRGKLYVFEDTLEFVENQ